MLNDSVWHLWDLTVVCDMWYSLWCILFLSQPWGSKSHINSLWGQTDLGMVTALSGCDTDYFVLSRCRNPSVLTSILKGEQLFLLLVIYMVIFAQGANRANPKFELCCTRHCFVQGHLKKRVSDDRVLWITGVLWQFSLSGWELIARKGQGVCSRTATFSYTVTQNPCFVLGDWCGKGAKT